MSQTIEVNSPQQREAGIEAAQQALSRGECVVFPTDTVYGIGADAFSPQAVAVLLAAKGRGRQKPPPVLIGRTEIMRALAVEIPESAEKLAKAFWPGGLTIILQAQHSLSWDLGETRGTVALRMPADEVALDLLAKVGPMAVSSANRTTQAAATSCAEAEAMLAESVSVYLDGGERTQQLASTIVDCTAEVPTVVRAGAVTLHELQAVVPETVDVEAQAAFVEEHLPEDELTAEGGQQARSAFEDGSSDEAEKQTEN